MEKLLPKSQSHFVYDVVCWFEACTVIILVPNCFSVSTVIMFLIEKICAIFAKNIKIPIIEYIGMLDSEYIWMCPFGSQSMVILYLFSDMNDF